MLVTMQRVNEYRPMIAGYFPSAREILDRKSVV